MGINNWIAKKSWRKSIDCSRVRDLSSDFLEGGLPHLSRKKIQAHLRVCLSCTAFIKSLASTIAMLSKLPKSQPPVSLKRKIRECVENGK